MSVKSILAGVNLDEQTLEAKLLADIGVTLEDMLTELRKIANGISIATEEKLNGEPS